MCEPFLQLTFRIFRFKSYNAYWTCTYPFIILKANLLVIYSWTKKNQFALEVDFFSNNNLKSSLILITNLKYALNFENLQGHWFLCYPPLGIFSSCKFEWGCFSGWCKGYEEKNLCPSVDFLSKRGGDLFKFVKEYMPLEICQLLLRKWAKSLLLSKTEANKKM